MCVCVCVRKRKRKEVGREGGLKYKKMKDELVLK